MLAGNPYGRFRELPADLRQILLLREIERVRRGAVWSVDHDGGMLAVTPSAWDSERLGVSVVRVHAYGRAGVESAVRAELVNALRAGLGSQSPCYAVARVVEADLCAVEILGDAGFQTDGTLVNLALSNGAPGVSARSDAVSVRRAAPGDEAFVRHVARRCFENRWLHEPRLDPERVRSLYADWAANDLRGRCAVNLIAEIDAVPAGYFSGDVKPAAAGGPLVGFVDLIVVDDRVRRQGVGQALMAAGMEQMRQRGADLLELNVAGSNSAAVALYRRLGFEERLRYLDLSRWWDA